VSPDPHALLRACDVVLHATDQLEYLVRGAPGPSVRERVSESLRAIERLPGDECDGAETLRTILASARRHATAALDALSGSSLGAGAPRA
jgi:hypothetical protein